MTETLSKKKLDEERERSYEHGLPEYLQNDLDAYKDGLRNGSTIMDCYSRDKRGFDYTRTCGLFKKEIFVQRLR